MDKKFRLNYVTTSSAASFDKTIFGKWEERLITTEQARRVIEKSVEHSVSKEAFLANAKWLGYSRD